MIKQNIVRLLTQYLAPTVADQVADRLVQVLQAAFAEVLAADTPAALTARRTPAANATADPTQKRTSAASAAKKFYFAKWRVAHGKPPHPGDAELLAAAGEAPTPAAAASPPVPTSIEPQPSASPPAKKRKPRAATAAAITSAVEPVAATTATVSPFTAFEQAKAVRNATPPAASPTVATVVSPLLQI